MGGIGISRRASCERRIKPPPQRRRTSSHFLNDSLTRRLKRIRAPQPFWGAIGAINDNFGILGYIIIGVFLVAWIGSVIVYKVQGYDELEAQALSKPTSI